MLAIQQLRKQAMGHVLEESKSRARNLASARCLARKLCAHLQTERSSCGAQAVAPRVLGITGRIRSRAAPHHRRPAGAHRRRQQTAKGLRAFRADLQLQRVQFPRLVSGTVNRSVMLDTVLRALASAQGSSAIPRMFCTVFRYELVS